MIKALIIDDEPSAVNTLELMINHYTPEVDEVKSTNDPHEGLQLIKSFLPQVVFLDVQMPLLSGFDLLKQIPQIHFHLIFTTAHDQYAIEAIRFSALDYLLKPIDADELKAAVERLLEKEAVKKNEQALYSNLLHNLYAQHKGEFKLALSTTTGTTFHHPDTIIRLEGENNYTRFYFSSQKTILTSKTLKEYDDMLAGYGFIRTHKSHLVNIKYVQGLNAEGILILSDESRVEVSRRRRDEVFEKLKSR